MAFGKVVKHTMSDGVHNTVDPNVLSKLRDLHPRRPQVACPKPVLKIFPFPSEYLNQKLPDLQNFLQPCRVQCQVQLPQCRETEGQIVRSFVRSFVRLVVHSSVCFLVHSFVRLFVHSFILRSFIRSRLLVFFVRSFVNAFVCAFIRSFVLSFIHSAIPNFLAPGGGGRNLGEES